MDKETRNRIQRATQAARRLLEHECAAQLEGIFDVLPDGTIKPEPGAHLGDADQITRAKIVAAIEHRRAGGMAKAASVADYMREAAFTILNRFVALKMLEARGLILESVSRGEQSSGFSELGRLAPGLADVPDHGYRLYLECLFDELGREIGVLFDRRDPASLLWPRRQPFTELLAILNDPDLAGVWQEDETIGWVYQYFNTDADRERARYDDNGRPKAPQNTYELAIRNQFFTPGYVVQFLTDNTLGRTWYEMRQGCTRLADSLEYLVRRPNEAFLAEGKQPPAQDSPEDEELSQEERLKKTYHVRFRPKKDPRDLRILDPACGSGHFLLYAFDLLLTMYEEAWADEASPRSELTGRTMREDHPDLDDLRRALPGLILRENLHGIEIDPRCAQIAALALWMRAQRAFNDFGISRAERPLIAKTNVVIAEPMPGEQDLLEEFLRELREDRLEGLIREALAMPPENTLRATKAMADSLAGLVRAVWNGMELAGELGPLLKIELLLQDAVAAGREEWEGQLPLFRVYEYLLEGSKDEKHVRFEGRDQDFWSKAEQLTLHALRKYAAQQMANGRATTRQLFAEDAEQGFALVDLCRKRFDVVLMNPPFGDATPCSKRYLAKNYTGQPHELYACFLERSVTALCSGVSGQVTPREFLTYSSLVDLRQEILTNSGRLFALADLGLGVMDAAMVRAAAYIFDCSKSTIDRDSIAIRLLKAKNKHAELVLAIDSLRAGRLGSHTFAFDEMQYSAVGEGALAYWIGAETIQRFRNSPRFEDVAGDVRLGVQTSKNDQFLRLSCEVLSFGPGLKWRAYLKGGDFSKYATLISLVIDWRNDGAHILNSYGASVRLRELWQYERPGLNYPLVNEIGVNVSVLPSGTVFDNTSPSIYPLLGVDIVELLGLVNSRFVEFCFRCLTSTRHWQVGYLRRLPWCSPDDCLRSEIAAATQVAVALQRELLSRDELSPDFRTHACLRFIREGKDLLTALQEDAAHMLKTQVRLIETDWQLDHLAFEAFQVSDAERLTVVQMVGRHPCERSTDLESERTLGEFREDGNYVSHHRVTLFPIEQAALEEGCTPGELLLRPDAVSRFGEISNHVRGLISYWFGIGVGRWKPLDGMDDGECGSDDAFAPLRSRVDRTSDGLGILVDEDGQSADVLNAIADASCTFGGDDFGIVQSQVVEAGGLTGGLRDWVSREFFGWHIKDYSRSRRKAPIYWQLGTPSARYSVWLYYHRLTKDTFYAVLFEHVDPKLQHEEWRLGSLLAEGGDSPNAGQRRQIAEQEMYVEELRAFREEIARIAPLWNSNHDDGVIINFGPLWRLVPQHRAWQRECKACWDELVAEEYDWSHLAMHLWPERVVPKCADDRSLAIAHGLEDVFWFEDAGGKWKKREVPARSVEELVRERTSPAVKAALKSLLEAPAANGGSRRGGRRTAR